MHFVYLKDFYVVFFLKDNEAKKIFFVVKNKKYLKIFNFFKTLFLMYNC